MKKTLLLLMTCCAIKIADAQITFGPKLGINSFDQSADLTDSIDEPNTTAKMGYQVGGVVNFQIGDNFAIRPEVLFERIAVKYTSSINAGPLATATVDVFNKYNYLSVPINFVGMFNAGPGKINIFAGPQFSFGVGGKSKATETVSVPFFGNQSMESTSKLKPGKDDGSATSSDVYYNPINISMNAGLGYQYKRVLLSGQYNFGFTNVTPHSTDSAQEDRRDDMVIKNHGITVGLTFFFGSIGDED